MINIDMNYNTLGYIDTEQEKTHGYIFGSNGWQSLQNDTICSNSYTILPKAQKVKLFGLVFTFYLRCLLSIYNLQQDSSVEIEGDDGDHHGHADDGGDVGEGDDGEGDDHDENDENLGYDLSQGEAQPLVEGDRTVSIFIHRLFHGGDGGDGGGDGDDSHYGDSDDSGGDDDCDGGVNIMSLS